VAKISKVFVCGNCDAQFPKWGGQCSQCGAWGTIAEQTNSGYTKSLSPEAGEELSLVNLSETKISSLEKYATGLEELDRVFGGGLVAGSVVLLGGAPGVGKSTLALQAAGNLSASGQEVLYFSGEESATQVGVRYKRLGIKSSPRFSQAVHLESILKTLAKIKPSLAVIDAVQMLHSERISGEPGNLSQMRGGVAYLVEVAKRLNISLILISHVTKDGTISGPKTVEHLVDTVLLLEAENKSDLYRLLSSSKNRFGPTSELGVFSFDETGFHDLLDPAKIFLGEVEPAPGTALTLVAEGQRAFVLEVQALVHKSLNSFPHRLANGYDLNRLQMLLAVLTKWAKLPLFQCDVHINVSGGFKVREVAVDVAVCLAIASSFYDKIIPLNKLFWGEVSLNGQLRRPLADKRLTEIAKKLGYGIGVADEKTLAQLLQKNFGK